MARIRSVHPGLFTDEAFVASSPAARIMLIGLWTESDDNGVFEWKPLQIKMRIMPADPVNVSDLLGELEQNRIIKRFEADGKVFGAVRNFTQYQRPKSPKVVHPLPSDIAPFVGIKAGNDNGLAVTDGENVMTFPRDLTAAERQRRKRERDAAQQNHGQGVTEGGDGDERHGSNVTDGEMSRQMEEGGGRKKEDLFGGSVGGADATDTKSSGPDQGLVDAKFEEFWSAMPKRGRANNPKKPAREKFARFVKKGVKPDEIISGARVYASAMRQSGKDGTEFVQQAVTFLNQEIWRDYANVEQLEPWRTDPKAWTDRERPPPWPDAPLGTLCGPWRKTPTTWAYLR
ncbi:hypothetical protein [Azospirillum sp. sgz302134]